MFVYRPDLVDDLRTMLTMLMFSVHRPLPVSPVYDLTIAVVLNSPSSLRKQEKDTCQNKWLVHCNFSRIWQCQTVFSNNTGTYTSRICRTCEWHESRFRKTSLWFTPLIPGRSWFLYASCCLLEMSGDAVGLSRVNSYCLWLCYVYMIVYVLVWRENTF